MQFEVGTDLQSVVVELLEAELLVDAHSSSLALKADGFCLDRVLTVRPQLQLDADIAGREDIRVEDIRVEHYLSFLPIICLLKTTL